MGNHSDPCFIPVWSWEQWLQCLYIYSQQDVTLLNIKQYSAPTPGLGKRVVMRSFDLLSLQMRSFDLLSLQMRSFDLLSLQMRSFDLFLSRWDPLTCCLSRWDPLTCCLSSSWWTTPGHLQWVGWHATEQEAVPWPLPWPEWDGGILYPIFQLCWATLPQVTLYGWWDVKTTARIKRSAAPEHLQPAVGWHAAQEAVPWPLPWPEWERWWEIL